jgi:hypothetical protein
MEKLSHTSADDRMTAARPLRQASSTWQHPSPDIRLGKRIRIGFCLLGLYDQTLLL